MMMEAREHEERLWTRRVRVAALLGTALLLAACPAPFDVDVASRVTDAAAPALSVESPEDGSSYPATVVVEGSVDDGAGAVEQVTYEVLGSSISGAAVVSDDGGFSFSFPTSSLSGSITVEIAARDWNGNETTATLSLVDEGQIPSFRAEIGSGAVTLRWDDIPFSTRYDVYYTADGSLPSSDYGSALPDVSSPYTLDGLRNGAMHVFVLRSVSSEGEDNVSAPLYAIPSSELTVQPVVEPGYEEMRLVWPELSAADSYEVWRSNQIGGTYRQISGTLAANQFTDRQVVPGTTYYYRVRPSIENALTSGPTGGAASPFAAYTNPLVGKQQLETYSWTLGTRGRYAFVRVSDDYGDDGFTIRSFDTSNPVVPYLADKLTLPSYPNDGVIVGDYLYVASEDGITVVDVSDPEDMSIVSTEPTGLPTPAVGLDYAAGYLYVAVRASGGQDAALEVVDLSDPTEPQRLASPRYTLADHSLTGVSVAADADRVAVYGFDDSTNSSDYALTVLATDLSNPASFSLAWRRYANARVKDVASDGSTFYVARGSTGFTALDAASATGPATLTASSDNVVDVALYRSGWAVLTDAGREELRIVDISDPGGLREVHAIATGEILYDSVSDGRYVYSTVDARDLLVHDIRYPVGGQIVETVTTTNVARDLEVRGDLLLAATDAGLSVLDLSNPAAGYSDLAIGGLRAVAYGGDYAFASTGSSIRVVDLSSYPTLELATDAAASVGFVQDLALRGDYLLAADGDDGLRILDTTAIDDMRPTTLPVTFGWPVDVVETDGTYAYVAGYDTLYSTGGIAVVDLSDPFVPVVTDSTGAATWLHGMDYQDGYLYVVYHATSSERWLRIYDVSDPRSITYVGGLEGGTALSGNDSTLADARVEVDGTYAYVSTEEGPVHVVDVSDPTSPVLADTLASGDFAETARVDLVPWGARLIVAERSGVGGSTHLVNLFVD